jgi:hypothetical protein
LPPQSPPTATSPSAATTPPITYSGGFVSSIANTLSSISSALVLPDRAILAYFTDLIVASPHALRDPASSSISQMDLDLFSTGVDTECCICFEPQRSMRRLVTCHHVFCEDCLWRQINSQCARARDCALCRRDMFDLEGIKWESQGER